MAAKPLHPTPAVADFLQPLHVDSDRVYNLSREFATVFKHLAAESKDQFLPTPISESILLPPKKRKNQGRYLAIDIGGTNLRVGFIELLPDPDGVADKEPCANDAADAGSPAPRVGSVEPEPSVANNLEAKPDTLNTPGVPGTEDKHGTPESPYLRRLYEHSWPIHEHLKSENAESLFAWIGGRIASVVCEGCAGLGLPRDVPLPMGVTFSFPMEQDSLSEAKLMSMGKGFTMTSKLDLGSHLVDGYEKARSESKEAIPSIKIAAIANDSVATLISFVYETPTLALQKAAMGLICGTGCNATLMMKSGALHISKRPKRVNVLPGAEEDDEKAKIAVNTEWSINGTAPAMRAVNLISSWDDQLSAVVESPGFQPLEYMTAGRYLGELGRILLFDYMTNTLGVDKSSIPAKFFHRFEPRNTTFLSDYRPGGERSLLAMLEAEFPVEEVNGKPNGAQNGDARAAKLRKLDSNGGGAEVAHKPFQWTEDIAEALYHIAKAIEVRGAGIVAAAVMGLLDCAEELPPSDTKASPDGRLELVVGYTGGCITNFQDYLADCQKFLDEIVAKRYDDSPAPPIRIVLKACHDGGIKGAGILVPASLVSQGLAEA